MVPVFKIWVAVSAGKFKIGARWNFGRRHFSGRACGQYSSLRRHELIVLTTQPDGGPPRGATSDGQRNQLTTVDPMMRPTKAAWNAGFPGAETVNKISPAVGAFGLHLLFDQWTKVS